MAPTPLRFCHRLSSSPARHQPRLLRGLKLPIRSLTSATPRSPAETRLHQHAHIQSPSTPIPNLCLGAGGKAPGFVQQMLFSAPVQDKIPKGLRCMISVNVDEITPNIRTFLGEPANGHPTSGEPPRPSHTFKYYSP
jgi:hypothetical protein